MKSWSLFKVVFFNYEEQNVLKNLKKLLKKGRRFKKGETPILQLYIFSI